ncbi:alpha/beta hydrolase [Conexibacter stalactiti]|uniref:Alpha/beta hydrolase n=1 Tax=Conexibacter stalactiti TaxID=1940611 RepID=A0ABU4HPJ8_9ACTN|nr:alpha/beta hydrolase [Conexibacter stalactiti]MDW5595228.1 alpha/beta hydrolase [Conexibacter stalactiti]MEC5035870.1 alpha/beta hydrolase [Conexibacter stalactiti]
MAAVAPPSLRSRAVVAYLRAQRRRRRLEERERFLAGLPDPRAPERCGPPRQMRRTHAVRRGEAHGAPFWTVAARSAPRPAANAPVQVLYLHGGAYVSHAIAPHWWLVGQLARRFGVAATVPLYPLAPLHNCDDAFPFVLAHYRDLLERSAAERIVVMGDSAGGGLALALAQLARAEGLPQPARIALLSPWLDVSMSNAAEIDPLSARDPMLAAVGLAEAGRLWAGERSLEDPLVSPLHADLAGLAPISTHIGTHDILLPDARRFARAADAAGHALEHVEYPGMFHVFMAAPIPEARRAMTAIAAGFPTPPTEEEQRRWTSS